MATTWAVYLDAILEAKRHPPGLHPRSDSIQGVALGAMLMPPASFTPTAGRVPRGCLTRRGSGASAAAQAQIQATKNSELTSGTNLVARWGLVRSFRNVGGLLSSPLTANGTITGTRPMPGPGFCPAATRQLRAGSSDPERARQRRRHRHLADPRCRGVRSRQRSADGHLVRPPLASGTFTQIAQHPPVASGTSTSATWSSLGDGQKFEWYATVSDGSLTTGPTWTFSTSRGMDPVFVGAGDIAACGPPQDNATAA